jgi:hypothetical protein
MYSQKTQILDQVSQLEKIIDGQMPKMERAEKYHNKNVKEAQRLN